jgi:SAM-dependent methyltransferase
MTAGVPAFSPSSDQSFLKAAAVIRDVQETEHRWFAQGDPKSPVLPWMPFQPADFLSIVFECIPELTGREFLDTGCGPGTKMRLARHFFGMSCWGIEIDPAMADTARGHGNVICGDALQVPDGTYADCDLIWLYRPFRDPELEEKLEARIMDEMKPGAILAGGAWELCPADFRWHTVVDDWELRRGAWIKPRPVATLQL